jgi:hypothetical protein
MGILRNYRRAGAGAGRREEPGTGAAATSRAARNPVLKELDGLVRSLLIFLGFVAGFGIAVLASARTQPVTIQHRFPQELAEVRAGLDSLNSELSRLDPTYRVGGD